MRARASALVARWSAHVARPEDAVARKLLRWSEAGRCDVVRRCARWPIVLRRWMRDVAGRCKRSGATERALAERKAAVSRRWLGFVVRRCGGRAPLLARRLRGCRTQNFNGGRRRRPPLRQSSGDVVTAESF
ncbi:hypothetical protein F511_36663 [Dorcoceras hygrometricum]|uniref:Uncharacterized protein n=1 Tax=Dorcoceras hygrometricum TaxID=472368 RepID=A0A2Z7A8Q8_9LAMI|nr:hypothetical protein F511_36663 [Dorcoceras hygrometricum]